MKNSKEKDLKEKELEVTAGAEALEADRELSPEELDGVSGGGTKVTRWTDELHDRKFAEYGKQHG